MSYVPLATLTLTNNDTSIDFVNIPGTYRDLVLIARIRTVVNANGDVARVRVNGDSSSANYPRVGMFGNGSTASYFNITTDPGFILQCAGSPIGTSANYFDFNHLQILDYAQTDKHKMAIIRQSEAYNTVVVAQVARWASTAAITSLQIVTDGGDAFVAGSMFSLYGISI